MIYSKSQIAAIREMARAEKKVELPTAYNKQIRLVLKLWTRGEQIRAYLNYVTIKPRYNGGTNWKSESLGYIDLVTGEDFAIDNAWDELIAKMGIPPAA